MPFGFGASSARSSSSSQSLDIGEQFATSFGTSGSEGTGTSGSESFSRQDIAFEDLFKNLYSGAAATAAGVDPSKISGAANQLFSGGLGFLEQLTGPNAGTAALESRLTDTSARDANLAALRTGLGDFFSESLLPAITGRGVSTGTLGGSRDAVEKAQAAKAVAGQYSSGAASILSGDQAQRDAAAGTLASLKQQGAGQGLGALGGLLGLQEAGATAGFAPHQLLASILGGPTVLGTSGSTSFAEDLSRSFSEQGSKSYGYDFGTSSSTSKSKSKSFNVGVGGGGGGAAG